MSPDTVDSYLGAGASLAGWTGKLYGLTRNPTYSHPVHGRGHKGAKSAKAAWVAAEMGQLRNQLQQALGEGDLDSQNR